MQKILIVEDNPIDARLVSRALELQKDWQKQVKWVRDGEDAIDYLMQRNGHGTADRPDVVLLDLNLPKVDGTEVLRFIRGDKGLRGLRVFVVSSSPLDVIEEKIKLAHVEADRYFTKPVGLAGFDHLIREIRGGMSA